jgi:hypothetical protein
MSLAILVACLVAQASNPAAMEGKTAKGQELQVRYLSGAMVTTMSQLEDALSRSWLSVSKGSFTVRGQEKPRRWIKISNCAELKKIDVKAADTRPADAWQYLVGQARWCRALEAIKRAKPSKRSFLAEPLAVKNPAQFLPASVADEINGRDDEEARQKGKSANASVSWAKSDPNLQLAEVQPKDRIELAGVDYSAMIVYYATGDFNGDGIEDLLLEVSIRAFDASQGDGAYFIMTRTKPDGLLKVIEKLP